MNTIRPEYIFMLHTLLPYDIKLYIVKKAIKSYTKCIICKYNETHYLACDSCILISDPIYGHIYV